MLFVVYPTLDDTFTLYLKGIRDTDYVFRRGKVGFKDARARERFKALPCVGKRRILRGVWNGTWAILRGTSVTRVGIDFSRRGGQRKTEGGSSSSLVGINFKG